MPTLASSPTSTLTDRWTVYVTGIDTAFDNRIVSGISEQVIRGGLSEQIFIEERDDAEVLDRWTENRDDLGADLWLMIRGIDDQQFLIIPTTPLTSPPLFRHDQAVIPWMSLLSGEPVLFLSQSDSTDIVEQFVLGLYAMHIEDYGIAETHFKRAQGLSLLLDESTHRNLNEGTLGVFIGAAQVGQGNATDALATFSRASRQSPELLSVYVNRAGAYLQLGDFNAALADLDRVVNQKADDPFVHYNMALALFSLEMTQNPFPYCAD